MSPSIAEAPAGPEEMLKEPNEKDLCGFPEVTIAKDNISTKNNPEYDVNGPLYQPPKPLWPGVITTTAPTVWSDDEVTFDYHATEGGQGKGEAASWIDYYADSLGGTDLAAKPSPANPTPGTGATGHQPIPPNNYIFYAMCHDDIIYRQRVMDDKLGYLTQWQEPYKPTADELKAAKEEAYRKGVPQESAYHKNLDVAAEGAADDADDADTVNLLVRSELHFPGEYGTQVDEKGKHSGGPARVRLPLNLKIAEVHQVLHKKMGLLPAHQCLAFAGKNFEDNQRTLEHYGVRYWHRKFPDWPLTVRRFKTHC